MTDRRPLLLLGGFLLLLVVGTLGYRTTTHHASMAVAQSVTTTAAPSTGGTGGGGIGVGGVVDGGADNIGEGGANGTGVATTPADWQAQLARVVAAENASFQNPDPTQVGNYMLPTCTCYTDTQQRLTNLQTKGWHVKGDTLDVQRSTFVSGTATSATIIVQPAPGGNPVVDATGKVVDPAPTGTAQPIIYVLNEGSDGVWRISDRHPLAEQIP